ncbi:MAG: PepSY domain-containing protein [Gammaproteobacteria bacterium]|nr:PepSY domain-containing protein [Gammaproteobacteria bacterium]
MIKLMSLGAALSILATGALAAGPECELAADQKWLEQVEFENKIENMGYVIDELLVSEGNCFEVTGKNSSGKDMTAYFHPQTGEVLQEDVVQ